MHIKQRELYVCNDIGCFEKGKSKHFKQNIKAIKQKRLTSK